ncbi:MAG: aspartate carbamoyltransferase regulatory subunit [archaeon]|jgi:aspartate carbamoyltransferase regulatory subunit|nr:aspartate carbamoyltransferase regulatory subunit [archaeon]
MTEKNEPKVGRIKNGTVLDHLNEGSAQRILEMIGVNSDYGNTVIVLMGSMSKSMERKDVIKIEDKFLEPEETRMLALIAPNATISIIKNYNIASKTKVSLPKKFIGVGKCPNPKCTTNQNEPISPVFNVETKTPLTLRCVFCENVVKSSDISSH